MLSSWLSLACTNAANALAEGALASTLCVHHRLHHRHFAFIINTLRRFCVGLEHAELARVTHAHAHTHTHAHVGHTGFMGFMAMELSKRANVCTQVAITNC